MHAARVPRPGKRDLRGRCPGHKPPGRPRAGAAAISPPLLSARTPPAVPAGDRQAAGRPVCGASRPGATPRWTAQDRRDGVLAETARRAGRTPRLLRRSRAGPGPVAGPISRVGLASPPQRRRGRELEAGVDPLPAGPAVACRQALRREVPAGSRAPPAAKGRRSHDPPGRTGGITVTRPHTLGGSREGAP